MLTLKCIECKNEFEAQRTSAKFCSTKCRVKFNSKINVEEVINHQTLEKDTPILTKEQKVPKLLVDKKGELQQKPNDLSMATIRATMEKINKNFGAGTVMFLGDTPLQGLDVISTGSLGVDAALGIGGLPRGRFVEIYGPESSGKTTLALQVIANAQKKGLKCLFIDAENSFDPEYAEALGVKVEELLYCQPACAEFAFETADINVSTGEIGVVVVDSVAALVPKAELEGESGDTKMGLMARLMSQVCRKMVGSIAKHNTLFLFLNQIRNKLGVVYGSPETTTGGMALQFYATIRLDIRRQAQLKDGDVILGNRTKVKVIKNKCAPPFRTAEFDVLYGQGVSKIGEIVDMGVEKGIITKSGSWYSYNEQKIGQGRDSVILLLNDNPEISEVIESKIMESFTKSK